MLISKETCNKLSDLDIVRQSLANIDYFSCLHDRYESRLLRYIKRISYVTNEEAEDILQEAFIKIWKNLNDFNPSLKLSSWLYRIVHNQTISYWRKNKSLKNDHQIIFDENISQTIADDFQLDHEKEQLVATQIHSTLNQLPKKYKEVLILKYFEKMSYEEISDVLKIPEGTVATRINRAKKAFEKSRQ